jgi:uncharacterized protein
MNMRLLFAAFASFCLCWTPSSFAAPPTHAARVLFVTQSKGFMHGSVNRRGKPLAPAELAMTQLGRETGLFNVTCTQDCAADFTKANLQNYDIVMFYTTGDLPIKQSDLEYFAGEWLKQKGHGFIGFHSAADTYHENKTYWDMLGATFVTHPWQAYQTVTISVHDTRHPASRPFGKEFQIRDEIYRYRHWQPEKVRVLMSLNLEKDLPLLNKGGRRAYLDHKYPNEPYQVPIAWVKDVGEGKVFFTNLGHNESTWKNPAFLKSVEGGVRWILGLESGDATPNPQVSKAEEAKAKELAEKLSSKVTSK